MRGFVIAFAIILAVCVFFWVNDAPGSGMVYPTVFFALLLTGTLLENKFNRGGLLSDLTRSAWKLEVAKATANATSTDRSATTEADLRADVSEHNGSPIIGGLDKYDSGYTGPRSNA